MYHTTVFPSLMFDPSKSQTEKRRSRRGPPDVLDDSKLSDVEKVYKMLQPKAKQLLSNPNRRLLRHGPLKYFSPSARLIKNRYIFLFNDLILITKRSLSKRKKFYLKLFVHLTRFVTVLSIPSSTENEFRLLVTMQGTIRTRTQRRVRLYGASQEERESWVEDIKHCICPQESIIEEQSDSSLRQMSQDEKTFGSESDDDDISESAEVFTGEPPGGDKRKSWNPFAEDEQEQHFVETDTSMHSNNFDPFDSGSVNLPHKSLQPKSSPENSKHGLGLCNVCASSYFSNQSTVQSSSFGSGSYIAEECLKEIAHARVVLGQVFASVKTLQIQYDCNPVVDPYTSSVFASSVEIVKIAHEIGSVMEELQRRRLNTLGSDALCDESLQKNLVSSLRNVVVWIQHLSYLISFCGEINKEALLPVALGIPSSVSLLIKTFTAEDVDSKRLNKAYDSIEKEVAQLVKLDRSNIKGHNSKGKEKQEELGKSELVANEH